MESLDPYDDFGETRVKMAKIPQSAFQFSPGDILAFTYPGSAEPHKIVLVVGTKRGDGTFISSRRNHLITAYDLDIPPSFLPTLVRVLYKNVGRAKYRWVERNLPLLINRANFRTYNLGKCQQMKKIKIDLKDVI